MMPGPCLVVIPEYPARSSFLALYVLVCFISIRNCWDPSSKVFRHVPRSNFYCFPSLSALSSPVKLAFPADN